MLKAIINFFKSLFGKKEEVVVKPIVPTTPTTKPEVKPEVKPEIEEAVKPEAEETIYTYFITNTTLMLQSGILENQDLTTLWTEAYKKYDVKSLEDKGQVTRLERAEIFNKYCNEVASKITIEDTRDDVVAHKVFFAFRSVKSIYVRGIDMSRLKVYYKSNGELVSERL